MAFSAEEGKLFFQDYLIHVAQPLGFKSFLDIGCGAGRYGDIIRSVFGKDVHIDAVEAFVEYIKRYDLESKYDLIFTDDIRHSIDIFRDYDLIICGDVLEHLTKNEAILVVNRLKPFCKFLWAALPMKIDRPWSVGYQQHPDEWKENPFNQHYHDWTGDEIYESFSPLFVVPYMLTGTFLVEGTL